MNCGSGRCRWWSFCRGTELLDKIDGRCGDYETEDVELMGICPHCGYANTVLYAPTSIEVTRGDKCKHFAGISDGVFYWRR